MDKMFEVAIRTKMRFQFRGIVSVEDLWDLSVENLDTIYKALNSEKKKVNEESLLDTKTKEDAELEIKIEIVKHIVRVKLEEEKQRLNVVERKAQKQRILEIMSKKQDESLQNKTEEELAAMLDELG